MKKNGLRIFEGFSEMKYTMLLETNTGFDVSLDYYRYGLYDNSVKSRREGEELYFALHEKKALYKKLLITYPVKKYSIWLIGKNGIILSAAAFIMFINPDIFYEILRYFSLADKMKHNEGKNNEKI